MDELSRKLILLKEAIVRKATKDETFRKHLLEDPANALYQATGKHVPSEIEIRVYQDTRNILHIALPLNLASADDETGSRVEESSGTYGDHFPESMTEALLK